MGHQKLNTFEGTRSDRKGSLSSFQVNPDVQNDA